MARDDGTVNFVKEVKVILAQCSGRCEWGCVAIILRAFVSLSYSGEG